MQQPPFEPKAPIIPIITGIAFAALVIGALFIAPHAAGIMHSFHAHSLVVGLSLGLGLPAITWLALKHLKATPPMPVVNKATKPRLIDAQWEIPNQPSIPRNNQLDPSTFKPKAPIIPIITGIAFAALAIGALFIAPHAAGIMHTFHAHSLAVGLSLGLGLPAITWLALKRLKATPPQPIPNTKTLSKLNEITRDKATFTIKTYSHPYFTITIDPYNPNEANLVSDYEEIQREIASAFNISNFTPMNMTLNDSSFDIVIQNLPLTEPNE